jgi:hypothetical protein
MAAERQNTLYTQAFWSLHPVWLKVQSDKALNTSTTQQGTYVEARTVCAVTRAEWRSKRWEERRNISHRIDTHICHVNSLLLHCADLPARSNGLLHLKVYANFPLIDPNTPIIAFVGIKSLPLKLNPMLIRHINKPRINLHILYKTKSEWYQIQLSSGVIACEARQPSRRALCMNQCLKIHASLLPGSLKIRTVYHAPFLSTCCCAAPQVLSCQRTPYVLWQWNSA